MRHLLSVQHNCLQQSPSCSEHSDPKTAMAHASLSPNSPPCSTLLREVSLHALVCTLNLKFCWAVSQQPRSNISPADVQLAGEQAGKRDSPQRRHMDKEIANSQQDAACCRERPWPRAPAATACASPCGDAVTGSSSRFRCDGPAACQPGSSSHSGDPAHANCTRCHSADLLRRI